MNPVAVVRLVMLAEDSELYKSKEFDASLEYNETYFFLLLFLLHSTITFHFFVFLPYCSYPYK